MRKNRYVGLACVIAVALCLLIAQAEAQQPVVLQPWKEVYGSVDGVEMGKYVLGMQPTANFPFRAAVSQLQPNTGSLTGSTTFHRLESVTDTVKMTVRGVHPKVADFDGDGDTDVAVIQDYISAGVPDTVYIYWGTPAGLDTSSSLRIPAEEPYNGLRTSSAGDLNGDGRTDLVLAAVNHYYATSYGKVYVYLNPVLSSLPSDTLVGDTLQASLGLAAAMGDINTDGRTDLMVRGVKQSGPEASHYDYVNIYFGRDSGRFGPEFDIQMRTPFMYQLGLACFDVSGDGIDDLLWTTRDSTGDHVSVHFGRSNFSTVPDIELRNPGAWDFGHTVANAGDMNGDGYSEIAVGCPEADYTYGVVLVYGGGPAMDPFSDAAVSMSYQSNFGYSISTLGDVTGDGLADLLIGAPHDPFFVDRGYWGVFKGDSAIRVVTGVDDRKPEIPHSAELYQNYPNPFNPRTAIRFELPSRGYVRLIVYNMLGREVVSLVEGGREAGLHEVEFDGTDHPSGLYVYRLTVRDDQGRLHSRSRTMTLIK